MADVIAILWADVITPLLFKFKFGRCYANMTMDCHYVVLMADVICHWWLMEWPLVCDVADVITTLQM